MEDVTVSETCIGSPAGALREETVRCYRKQGRVFYWPIVTGPPRASSRNDLLKVSVSG